MAFGWDDLILGGMGLFGSLFGAKKQADTQAEAARISAAASKYAADLMAKANAEALAYQKAEADRAFASSEAARYGNYGQWAAGQRRLGTLGDLMGLGPREIPAYVPTYGASSGGGTGSASRTMPTFAWENNPNLDADIRAYFKSQGVSDQETPYWIGKAGELVARGKELNDPQYAARRLAAADIFGGGGGQSGQLAPRPYVSSAYTAAPYAPTLSRVLTPALVRPDPYAPLSAYFG